MTGGEIAAAAVVGQVVKHAGKEIAKDSNSIRGELTEQAKQTPEFADAARSKAKRIAIRQEIATMIYKPITNLFGISNKYFENDFENDMAAKLAEVPEENIVAPKPSLAAPAMLQLGFSLDEPDLKEMYLNLLATASDDRKQEAAHPSFVEIIKQLSANEIKLLETLLSGLNYPLAIVRFKGRAENSGGSNLLRSNIIESTPASESAIATGYIATYIDNWIRLGLVTVNYDNYLVVSGAYDWVENTADMAQFRRVMKKNPTLSIDFDKGILRPTDFGHSFATAIGVNVHDVGDK
jgi:hypothetical protein